MGAVVPALEFMLTLAAECILVLCVLTYAMHCLLVVVRDTAAGQDEIVWPDEPFQDWALGALHLVGVVLIVLAPAGILARALRETWLPDDAALRFLLLAVPALGFLFPVALFSSLSASSRWFVFRPVVVWNMLRVAPSTFAVYAVSAVLAAGVAALGYAAVTRWVVLAPVAAAAAGAAFLIYARLLGRLAWKMGRLPSGKRKFAKKSAIAGDPRRGERPLERADHADNARARNRDDALWPEEEASERIRLGAGGTGEGTGILAAGGRIHPNRAGTENGGDPSEAPSRRAGAVSRRSLYVPRIRRKPQGVAVAVAGIFGRLWRRLRLGPLLFGALRRWLSTIPAASASERFSSEPARWRSRLVCRYGQAPAAGSLPLTQGPASSSYSGGVNSLPAGPPV